MTQFHRVELVVKIMYILREEGKNIIVRIRFYNGFTEIDDRTDGTIESYI